MQGEKKPTASENTNFLLHTRLQLLFSSPHRVRYPASEAGERRAKSFRALSMKVLLVLAKLVRTTILLLHIVSLGVEHRGTWSNYIAESNAGNLVVLLLFVCPPLLSLLLINSCIKQHLDHPTNLIYFDEKEFLDVLFAPRSSFVHCLVSSAFGLAYFYGFREEETFQ